MEQEAAAGRRRVGTAKEFAEEEAASSEDAAVRMHQPSLNAERHIAEGLPVYEQVEVVQ